MKKHFTRRILSLMLAVIVCISALPIASTSAADVSVADTAAPSVEIVSFMRGAQTDLRSSELLEARVTGYEGNVRELTYEWTNTLGTYLYVYNSHNMYYIDGTAGEVEIYNSKIDASNNMTNSGRAYKDKFTGEGYCWASVYGSNTSGTGTTIQDTSAYNGTISVTVRDKDGNIIGSDSHTGKVTTSGYLWWQTTNYSGIIDHKLQSDMDDVTIGLFEGDKRNVKDLLGESAILHITCVESIVSSGKIISGGSYISLAKEGSDYYITGIKAGTSTQGDAKVDLTIQKNQCKFHEYTTASATTTVYVFKKPHTDTTAYTLTLTDNLDSRCRYFIAGVEGKKQADGTILFEGLTPNTEYMVEVRAEYKDENNNTRYTYAYVYDTTLPIYTGTVEVYLNGTYDSETHTATGEKVNLEDVTAYNTLYAKALDGTEFVELKRSETATGTYSSILDEGSYHLYYGKEESSKIDNQLLTMHHADRTRYLFYNSVEYKSDGVSLGTDYFLTGSEAATRKALTKEGFVFTGWKDEEGNVYSAEGLLAGEISQPYVLEAQWEKGINVYLNVTLEHYDSKKSGHYTDDEDRHDALIDLMYRPKDNTSVDFADVFDVPTIINWDGESEFSHKNFEASRVVDDSNHIDETHYTSVKPLLVNVVGGNDYSVEVTKSGYEIYSLTSTEDAEGNVTLDVKLRYDPKNADLVFKIELDDEAKELVKEYPQYKPKAVDIKILSYYTDDYTNAGHTLEANDWYHITQHHDTFVTLYLDENGEAYGTYPVWMNNASNTETYYYRIKVVSYVLENGDIVYTQDSTEEDHKNVVYITPAGRFKATIEVDGGMNPDAENTNLEGAYFDAEGAQQGSLTGIISIKTHKVTFEPDGGIFSDGTTEPKTEDNLLNVPELSEYTPARDGGYVFVGWFEVDENGNTTDVAATSEKILRDDLTLRAVWRAPLTVEGKVFVAGHYHLNGDRDNVKEIPDSERTHAVTVYLQKVLPNSYTETIKTQKIDVVYENFGTEENPELMGVANYSFSELPDDGHEYRVLIQNPNYSTNYQNEPNSLDEEKVTLFPDGYNSSDFMAVFGSTEPQIADVNAFMEFEPHNFNLHYKVIASAIGEGYRPELADVLVLCYTGNGETNPQNWTVISQMVDGEEHIGHETVLSDEGIGNNSHAVWITKPDGHVIYDYAVRLDSYTLDSVENEVNDSIPFFIYYNGSARYDDNASLEGIDDFKQTQLLTIELQPKRYTINFDQNFVETEEDHITGFEKYTVSAGKYLTGHIWSYETDLSDAVPVREGYKFLGWYDEDGNRVTKIDAGVAQDMTLTARWTKLFTVTFHANNDCISEDIFRIYCEKGNNPEGVLTLEDNNTVASFYDLPEFSYEDHNNYIFKGWYLDEDNDNDSRPISWSDVYTEDTDVYAHWIYTGEVAKDSNDTKQTGSDTYKGYDLVGVQVRDVKAESAEHYGTAGTGLRFVAVLSENVYSQINDITDVNKNGAEYGFVVAKKTTAQKYAQSENYTLQYKGTNVNGADTTSDYTYVQNMKCSGVPDHRNYTDYRLYTAVITYDKVSQDALESAHNTEMSARAYIRYGDANGLFRTYYNNYDGNVRDYNACSASFDFAKSLLG